jgi:hypothetical protein
MGFNSARIAQALIELAEMIKSGQLEYKSGDFSIGHGYPDKSIIEISYDSSVHDSGHLHIEVNSNLVLVMKKN